MDRINERPSLETKSHADSLVELLPYGERIPRRSGDVAFDHAWEIRALSMTLALQEKLGFPWEEFQHELIAAIRDWETANPGLERWSYYERWMTALEELARAKGWVTKDELDAQTEKTLAVAPNAHHQHAAREPVTVVPGTSP